MWPRHTSIARCTAHTDHGLLARRLLLCVMHLRNLQTPVCLRWGRVNPAFPRSRCQMPA
jgi:hypothetical protein